MAGIMLHPTFAAHPGPLRHGGPADDSDEDTPLQGRAYARTPFPPQRMLGSPPDETDSDVVVPGQRPRSYSNPTPSPFVNGTPGSAFGSPEYELGQVPRGPFNPPQPGVMPAKSSLRSTRRATMDQLRGLPTIIGSPSVPELGLDAGFPPGQPMPPGYPIQHQQRMGSVRGTPYAFRSGGMPTPMMHSRQQTPSVMSPRGMNMFPTPGQPQVVPMHTPGMPMHQMFPATPLPPGVGPYGKPPSQPPMSLSGMRTPMQAMPVQGAMQIPGGLQMQGMRSMPVLPQQWPATGSSSHPDRRRRRKHRRRHNDDESDGSGDSASPPRDKRNPLPEPPRILTMQNVSPDGSIRVDSPPATNPLGRPDPPPKPQNPLPVLPKSIIAERNASAELEAANDAVKRAKEQTELARAKAIQRLEAEAWRDAGVPIGGDEENPTIPLIPGVTAPGILPTAAEPTVARKKPRPATVKKGEMVMSNVKTRRRRDEESEEEEEEEEEERPQATKSSGIGSLFKRISTRHRPDAPNGPPPPVAPKPPPKRGSKQPPPRPPPLPTHNSFDMPANEPIIPRGSKRATIDAPFRSQVITSRPTPTSQGFQANGQQMAFPTKPGMQQQPVYDPNTQEWYDPTNGQWWNPNTRKYYHKRAATVAPYVSGVKGEKDKGGGLMSMFKRWTTNTAPDDQPRPITAQLIMPGAQGNGAGQQPIVVLPDHPHSGRHRRRTVSAGESDMPISWYGTRQRRQSGRTSTQAPQRPQIPQWATTPHDGHHPGLSPDAMMMMGGPPGHVGQGNIYFSRKQDPYGAFRLDTDYPVFWGGLEAQALNWLESGKFENVTTGLGSIGMGTGWTRPSTTGGPGASAGKRGAKRLLKGLLGRKKSEEGLKDSRMEYARARTEYSEMVLRARGAREVDRLVSQFTLEGAQRGDWGQVYRQKLDEINFLKFQQHEVLLNMLLGTGDATIVFNSENAELGDGGHVNGASGHGRNELGQSLMRVREILWERYAGEEEGGA